MTADSIADSAVGAGCVAPAGAAGDQAQHELRRAGGSRPGSKTSVRLADGRQLIYFDTAPHAGRDAADRRSLPIHRLRSELRYDPLLGTWVIYAGHRQDRMYLPGADDCPLCPSTADRATEIPAADYEVVVFENRFPALTSLALDGSSASATPDPGRLLIARPSSGRCEVICYTSDHDSSFADLRPERARLVLEALIDRSEALGALPGVQQVYCFENRGREIGVTQPRAGRDDAAMAEALGSTRGSRPRRAAGRRVGSLALKKGFAARVSADLAGDLGELMCAELDRLRRPPRTSSQEGRCSGKASGEPVRTPRARSRPRFASTQALCHVDDRRFARA